MYHRISYICCNFFLFLFLFYFLFSLVALLWVLWLFCFFFWSFVLFCEIAKSFVFSKKNDNTKNKTTNKSKTFWEIKKKHLGIIFWGMIAFACLKNIKKPISSFASANSPSYIPSPTYQCTNSPWLSVFLFFFNFFIFVMFSCCHFFKVQK